MKKVCRGCATKLYVRLSSDQYPKEWTDAQVLDQYDQQKFWDGELHFEDSVAQSVSRIMKIHEEFSNLKSNINYKDFVV